MQPSIIGQAIIGSFRIGVVNTTFDDNVIPRLEVEGVNLDVTLKSLALSGRDPWNGHRHKSWNQSTIKIQIEPKTPVTIRNIAGVYVTIDATGRCAEFLSPGDQIIDADGIIWDVENSYASTIGGDYILCNSELRKAPLYQADADSTTWTKTRGSDARYRTKVWLDTYLRSSQITKNDDSTQATWATIFNDPPYPLSKEFTGPSGVNGLYVIEPPDAEPLIDGVTREIYGFNESIPIHCMAVDKLDCNGDALVSKMEQELRYIVKTYWAGSIRNMDRSASKPQPLGSMMLYDTTLTLRYVRDTAT